MFHVTKIKKIHFLFFDRRLLNFEISIKIGSIGNHEYVFHVYCKNYKCLGTIEIHYGKYLNSFK